VRTFADGEQYELTDTGRRGAQGVVGVAAPDQGEARGLGHLDDRGEALGVLEARPARQDRRAEGAGDLGALLASTHGIEQALTSVGHGHGCRLPTDRPSGTPDGGGDGRRARRAAEFVGSAHQPPGAPRGHRPRWALSER